MCIQVIKGKEPIHSERAKTQADERDFAMFKARSVSLARAGNLYFNVPVLSDLSVLQYKGILKLLRAGAEFGRPEFDATPREAGVMIVFGEDGSPISPDDVITFYREVTDWGKCTLWYLTEPVKKLLNGSTLYTTPDLPQEVLEMSRSVGFTVLFIKNDEAGAALRQRLIDLRVERIEETIAAAKGARVIPPFIRRIDRGDFRKTPSVRQLTTDMLAPNSQSLEEGALLGQKFLELIDFHELRQYDADAQRLNTMDDPHRMPIVFFYEYDGNDPQTLALARDVESKLLCYDLDLVADMLAVRDAGVGYIPMPEAAYMYHVLKALHRADLFPMALPIKVKSPRRKFIRRFFERKGHVVYYRQ